MGWEALAKHALVIQKGAEPNLKKMMVTSTVHVTLRVGDTPEHIDLALPVLKNDSPVKAGDLLYQCAPSSKASRPAPANEQDDDRPSKRSR